MASTFSAPDATRINDKAFVLGDKSFKVLKEYLIPMVHLLRIFPEHSRNFLNRIQKSLMRILGLKIQNIPPTKISIYEDFLALKVKMIYFLLCVLNQFGESLVQVSSLGDFVIQLLKECPLESVDLRKEILDYAQCLLDRGPNDKTDFYLNQWQVLVSPEFLCRSCPLSIQPTICSLFGPMIKMVELSPKLIPSLMALHTTIIFREGMLVQVQVASIKIIARLLEMSALTNLPNKKNLEFSILDHFSCKLNEIKSVMSKTLSKKVKEKSSGATVSHDIIKDSQQLVLAILSALLNISPLVISTTTVLPHQYQQLQQIQVQIQQQSLKSDPQQLQQLQLQQIHLQQQHQQHRQQ
eukprot:TRINITY_DN20000_c0_g1_i1.p1 TRINITY_DN20000_c0_g1~~TRINITY_DN20000_c0_g1_i1.p1  ORF type:complete len:353 (-),score=84.16 TRINITY_DN20000_c0_g1_i1:150-1208(-)